MARSHLQTHGDQQKSNHQQRLQRHDPARSSPRDLQNQSIRCKTKLQCEKCGLGSRQIPMKRSWQRPTKRWRWASFAHFSMSLDQTETAPASADMAAFSISFGGLFVAVWITRWQSLIRWNGKLLVELREVLFELPVGIAARQYDVSAPFGAGNRSGYGAERGTKLDAAVFCLVDRVDEEPR